MNKTEFLAADEVEAFATWLAQRVSSIRVHLRIGRSRFVPVPMDVVCHGFEQVKDQYVWRSAGMQDGRWDETNDRLATLAKNLQAAANEDAALLACRDILAWGGNRNWNVGAYPFLRGLARRSELRPYLASTRNALALAAADCKRLVPPVLRMNAMLTKVHALNAADGLPIYDSRVAAASASLVELWRRDQANGQPLQACPPSLAFPATVSTRTVNHLFPDAQAPGILQYADPDTPAAWTQAKVRLGWLIEQVLGKAPALFNPTGKAPLAQRMRAFEAVLFLIGYNVRCLQADSGPDAQIEVRDPDPSEPVPGNGAQRQAVEVQEVDEDTPAKQRMPLSGKGRLIEYWGDVESGFDVVWGETYFTLTAEFITELLNHFEHQKSVPLGALLDRAVPVNSLGHWIKVNHGMARIYASCIAAILVNEKAIKRAIRPDGAGPNAIYLDFTR